MKLSCPESARPGLPDSPRSPSYATPHARQRKSQLASRRRLSENQRGPLEREEETEGATPSRFALAICPPFPPPRPSRSREITRSDARITSIQQGNQHGAASPTHPHSRLGESSAQVPFKLLCSLQFLQIHAVMPHGRFSCPSRSCAFFWFFSEEIERSDEFSCLILVGCNPFSLPRFLVGLVVLVVSM